MTLPNVEILDHRSAEHHDGVQGYLDIEVTSESPLFEFVNQLLMSATLPSCGIDPSVYRLQIRVDYMADPHDSNLLPVPNSSTIREEK